MGIHLRKLYHFLTASIAAISNGVGTFVKLFMIP